MVEPLSLDEAFLDVTKNKLNLPYASKIALLIRKEIQTDIGLTASAGISINKFTAKVATEINKPNGQKNHSARKCWSLFGKFAYREIFWHWKSHLEKNDNTRYNEWL